MNSLEIVGSKKLCHNGFGLLYTPKNKLESQKTLK